MYVAVPFETLGLILPLILGVAFLVLAEWKVMTFAQHRFIIEPPCAVDARHGFKKLSFFFVSGFFSSSSLLIFH